MKEVKRPRQYLGFKTVNRMASIFLIGLTLTVILGFGTGMLTGLNAGVAHAESVEDTDSQIGLGFSGTTTPPSPTPTHTTTIRPTISPTPTSTQSAGPVIPGSSGQPSKETSSVNPLGNLAKTGWINIQTWLFALGILGSVFLFWAFIVIRRQREQEAHAGLEATHNNTITTTVVGSDTAAFGHGENK